MSKIVVCFLILFSPFFTKGQSETITELRSKFDGDGFTTLFFYKNTLKMLNQTNNKEFDEAVKNIEKLRFVMIDKTLAKFTNDDFKKLLNSYKGESFEEIMTTRMDGKNFEVLLKDQKGSPLGTVVLVNDGAKLYIMDMLGSIDLKRASSIFSGMEQNTDLQNKIKSMMKGKTEEPAAKQEVKVE